ncbi:MAG: UDP-N-acetylmuramoyl-L-alanyl-D-glutamate--2,6-diaminopimelate ligase [Methylotenera sp.]|nr:UDP-N-acetylmuramoyl-L-alanyl-D-glutamate--2,6-diaminopimelate ligase [Methylotenera sp.]
MSVLTDFNLGHRFTSITADSRKVQAGTLFLAYLGAKKDGRDFIPQAIRAGAAAVLWEEREFVWNSNWQVPNQAVRGLKLQAGEIAGEYYGNPSNQLTMIGVTGTNGKTSVSQWIAQCLTILGKKTAVLGTIGNGFVDNKADVLTESSNTTPDALLLQGMLADYLQQQASAVVMEVSSHGLEQGRVHGVAFDIAILTNLSRDHLDYHQTMEAYAAAKKKLFDWQGLNMPILNVDDAFGQSIASSLKQKNKSFMTYGVGSGDIRASDLILSDAGISMQVATPQGNAQITTPVLGRFNAYNVLAVLSTLLALDIDLHDAVKAITQIKPVLGRMQQFGGGELPLVVIDYAHTPDALEKVLSTLKEQIEANKKLVCVFGCGGDRDAGKRPIMGSIARKLADNVVVTSDNPRSEDPTEIIQQIMAGMTGTYAIEPDRATAITMAVKAASHGDIVLIAGKGHENYQEILGVKYPFSDALVAQSALKSASRIASL